VITGKVRWEAVKKLIEKEAGPIRSARQISEGRNSEISVIVHTDTGAVFVKGRRGSHAQAWTQKRERAINPSVRHISPCLKWSASDDEWELLGFEYISGRHADYSPGSPDIPKVVRTMLDLQQVACPDIELKQAEQRWAAYTQAPELFAGACLLHTDWNPGNVLVSDRAYLVDWAWPTKGASWIDPACWAVWLIASCHSPTTAESWAAHIPSWKTAPAHALDEFARTQARVWADIAAESSETWKENLARAARQWATHRDALPRH
jgi:thiamine kinase-like enzyme